MDLLRVGESIAFVLQVINNAGAKKRVVELPKLKRLAVRFRVKGRVEALLEALL